MSMVSSHTKSLGRSPPVVTANVANLRERTHAERRRTASNCPDGTFRREQSARPNGMGPGARPRTSYRCGQYLMPYCLQRISTWLPITLFGLSALMANVPARASPLLSQLSR